MRASGLLLPLVLPRARSFSTPSVAISNRQRSNLPKKQTFQTAPPYLDITPLHHVLTSVPVFEQSVPLVAMYSFLANILYLLRRSHIRNMSKRKLLRIRLTREDGVSIPLYITNLLVWQLFVNFVFPILEPISRVFGYVSFYYFYPNASGLGIIFEPLRVQNQTMNKRAKHQVRLDWHRFSVNVGDIGRDGFRHPPSVEMNMPHLDVPKLGWKHWPWRRKYASVQRKIC